MLPASARLRRRRDFQAIYRVRKSWAGTALALHARRGREGEPMRFGFVISKKVAKRAHVRNRLKRRMREICRCELLPALRGGGADVLFVARVPAAALGFAALRAEMHGLMRQSGLLPGQAPMEETPSVEAQRGRSE